MGISRALVLSSRVTLHRRTPISNGTPESRADVDCRRTTKTLEQWARRPKTEQALARRARIVLACATGKANHAVAVQFKTTGQTVGRWRRRFVARRLDGLLDDPRRGTTSLFAALNVKTGQVLGQLHQRPRTREFRKFLDMIEATIPAQSAHASISTSRRPARPGSIWWSAGLPC